MKRSRIEKPIIVRTTTLLRSFFVVSGWTGLSRISGVAREMILANIFGANVFTDIYSFAIKLPNFFRRFFAEGALNAVLVPKFSSLIAHDTTENVRKFTYQMFSVLVTGLVVFVAVFEGIMPWVVKVIAPGFRNNLYMYSQVVYYARWLFPYILLISMVAFMSTVLNSMHRFAWAAAISIIVNISMIFALIIGKALDASVSLDFIMHLLCWSVLIGGVFQSLILWEHCKKHGIKIRLVKPVLSPEIKILLKRAIPGMIGASVMQINVFVDMAFGSLLPVGSISYLSFADRLNQLPLSLFGIALGTTLLPSLSKLWAANNAEEAYKTQNNAFILGFLLSIPAAVGLFLLAEQIVGLLYGHGRFNHFAVVQTMLALKAFVFGLPFYVVTKIFSSIFFANKDTKTPVIIAIICVLINGILNYILKDYFAHVGIAMATAISAFINALLGFIFLYRRKLFLLEKYQWMRLAKVLIISFLMGISVVLTKRFIIFNEGSFIAEMVQTFVPITVGIGVYISLISLFRVYSKK